MYFLKKNKLHDLLQMWNKSMEVYTPIRNFNEINLGKYNKKLYTEKYINFTLPIKEYIFKPKEELFNWEIKKNNSIKIFKNIRKKNEKNKIFFGIRSCDSYGIKYMDRFFLKEFKDYDYENNRKNIFIVQFNCLKSGDYCFCSSLNLGGPFKTSGEDIEVTPLKKGYIFESHTLKGNKLLNYSSNYFLKIKNIYEFKKQKDFLLKKSLETFKEKINFKNIKKVLELTFFSNLWKDISKLCIACMGCTNVCPTCTCFNVIEENKNKKKGTRLRCWDSCQNLSFTLNAGNHNTRDLISKTRFRIYDKLKYIEERFGYKGCTGCGRCIEICPTNINIITIIKKLIKESKKDINKNYKNNSIEYKDYKIYDRINNKNLYIPKIATIVDIINENKNIKRFKIKYDDFKLHEKYKFEGQFFKITVFGIGEIAISIPFGEYETKIFDFAIKKVGKVTSAMHTLKVGDKIGLRGPFGNTFPFEKIKGKNIIIIGSGVGLAPIRSIISQIVYNKKLFGKITIIISGLNYESIIYKEDFIKWNKLKNIEVIYCLSKKTNKVKAHILYVNDILKSLNYDWKNIASVVCASPNRIKLVANDLLKMGVDKEKIFLVVETHMRCGVGKCGHCKVGSKYICIDGPILNYSQLINLPPEY